MALSHLPFYHILIFTIAHPNNRLSDEEVGVCQWRHDTIIERLISRCNITACYLHFAAFQGVKSLNMSRC